MASRPGGPDAWTTRRLLGWMAERFGECGIDSPRLCAEMLVAHVLGCDRLKLYTDPDRPASPLERETLRGLVARALEHEPIQYLVGEAWFFGLPFEVDRRVLIPRPATQTMVEHVLQHQRHDGPGTHDDTDRGAGLLIADVCTGSGCIAVALAKNLPGARIAASDLSSDALAVASTNCTRHGVADRIDLLEGDLLAPFLEYPATRARGSLQYLLANPPYIPDDEWAAVEPNVKNHEPEVALRGGPDGLDLVRPVIAAAPPLLSPGGLLLVEVAASRAAEAAAIASAQAGLEAVQVLQDLDGLDRVILARRS
ncbi:MAG: peptide chain release factor N(5)-glutamine methyltransferase [Planctomycetota bacterium]